LESAVLPAIGSTAVAAFLILSLAMLGRGSGVRSANPLVLLCAAGLRGPAGQVVADYAREYGVRVHVEYGESSTMLGRIAAGASGDLLLVDEELHADLARRKGLVEEVIPLGIPGPAVAVLRGTGDPTAALQFARYLTARDRGLPAFAAAGYEVAEGDLWAEVPRLTFFVGLVNRRAIEEAIYAFQRREGVVVNAVYNGCGILNAQILAGRDRRPSGLPDLYMPGHKTFLEDVRDYFQEPVELSQTEIVMVVRKGNPKGIRQLKDLTRPGIHVVVGHPRQCTIGILTRELLDDQGLFNGVMTNVVAQMATSAMLIPALATGAADVALAWNVDARAEAARLDMIRIDSHLAKAVQPLAIGLFSDHKQLAGRLARAITASRTCFETAGFGWRLTEAP
jgi:ABC-type molybdate transport system substrate-binding protein